MIYSKDSNNSDHKNSVLKNSSENKKDSTDKLKTDCAQKTLDSNTGFKMQGICVSAQNYINQIFEIEDKPPEFFSDWITFAGNKINEENFEKIIRTILIGEYWDKNYDTAQYDSNVALFRGGEKYKYLYKNEIGITLKVRDFEISQEKIKDEAVENSIDKRYQCLLSLSGKVLQQLFKRNDIHSIAKFVDHCVKLGLHLTRIDLSIDDYQKRLKILDVARWTEQGNIQGFYSFHIHKSGGKVKNYAKTKIKGITVDCGSRESDKFVRIYDTFVKHKKKAIRFEGEFKDKKAKVIQDYFTNYCEKINCIYALNNCIDAIDKHKKDLLLWSKNILLSGINFCDKDNGKRVGTKIQYPLFEQWEKWLNYISEKFEKVKLVVCKKVHTVRDKFDFLNKQVKGTLSLITKGLSKENLLKLVDLLLLKDEDKKRPEIINKDRQLLIASMQKKGISAIFNDEELQNIFNEYGIDFGSQSSYYIPHFKEDEIKANKKILRGLMKNKDLDYDNEERLFEELNDPLFMNNYHQKQEKNLYEELLNNPNIIEFLAFNFPSMIMRIMDKLEMNQKIIIADHLDYLGIAIN